MEMQNNNQREKIARHTFFKKISYDLAKTLDIALYLLKVLLVKLNVSPKRSPTDIILKFSFH